VAAWLVYSAFFFLAWTANLLSHGETHFWLMVPGFDNPRFLNHVQTVAIPLLVAATAQASTRRATSALSWIALALCFAMLIGLVARASAISLLAGSLVALLVFGRAARPFIGRIFLGGVLGLLIYILIFQGIPYCLDLKTISSPHTSADLVSDHSRLYLWKIALDNIKTTPFLGVGPMHYAAQINGRGAHPHNIYLQLAAEFGLPFFLLLAVMIAAFVKRTICQIRLTSQAPDIITIATTAALASALVDGAFSGNFVMPMAQTWIYLTAGLFLAKVWRPIAVQPLAQTTNAVGVAVLVGIFSLQIWYSIETIHEYLHKPTTINSRPSLPETEANSPRFWLDGWL
jgi:O-antigen ligase